MLKYRQSRLVISQALEIWNICMSKFIIVYLAIKYFFLYFSFSSIGLSFFKCQNSNDSFWLVLTHHHSIKNVILVNISYFRLLKFENASPIAEYMCYFLFMGFGESPWMKKISYEKCKIFWISLNYNRNSNGEFEYY